MAKQKNQLDDGERVPFEISAEELKKALRTGERSIYQLRDALGWTYGKTQFIASKLIENGDAFFKEERHNGRSSKIISIVPFPDVATETPGMNTNAILDLKAVCAMQNEIIKKFAAITAGDVAEALPGVVTVVPVSCDVNVGKRIVKKIASDLSIDLVDVIEKSRAFLENEGDET